MIIYTLYIFDFYLDIDECKFLCDSQTQECINTNGSYTCVCKNGTGDEIICSGVENPWFKSDSSCKNIKVNINIM